MAQQGLSVAVKQSGRFKPANLDRGDLTFIGLGMVAAQKERWSKAINADGNPAKRLSIKYFFEKRKLRGGNPKRDMYMTGATVKNFALRKAVDGVIRAENTSRAGRAHANRAQNFEQMIGFAGSDQIAVFRLSQATYYGPWMQKAFIPIV